MSGHLLNSPSSDGGNTAAKGCCNDRKFVMLNELSRSLKEVISDII